MTQFPTIADLHVGMNIVTPHGSFTIAKITAKNISWYTDFMYKGGNGKNTLKMAWVSVKAFQKGLDSGFYKITN